MDSEAVDQAAELLGGGTARTEFRAQLIELEAGRRFEPHQHVSIHIILVLSGRGSLTLWTAGALEPTVYPVEAGDLFCIPRNARHAMAAAEDVPLRELIINIPGLALEDEERIVWDHPHHHPHTPG